MKICTQCRQQKPLDDFHKDKKMSDGRSSWCKLCKKAYYQAYHIDRYHGEPGYAKVRIQAVTTWRRTNPEQARSVAKVGAQKYRSRLAGLEGSWTSQEWEQVKKIQDYTCLDCGRKEPDITLTADHVIPISKLGSSNWIENIQGLCGPCNSRKGARI
jgi:5-methylcytosine-specific restriction endonuclease McrA